MTAPRSVADRIRDIIDAVESVEAFTNGLVRDSFAADRKTVYAVTRAIEIIGEAVKNVPEKVRKDHPGVPWKEMAGMRDKLIHDYPAVDVGILWEVAIRELPALRPVLRKVLEVMTGESGKSR
jgi:uncharacterized protein with HEPN domain